MVTSPLAAWIYKNMKLLQLLMDKIIYFTILSMPRGPKLVRMASATAIRINEILLLEHFRINPKCFFNVEFMNVIKSVFA